MLLERPSGSVHVDLDCASSILDHETTGNIGDKQTTIPFEGVLHGSDTARKKLRKVMGRRQRVREFMQLLSTSLTHARLGGLCLEPRGQATDDQRYQQQRAKHHQIVWIFHLEGMARRNEEEIQRDNTAQCSEYGVASSKAECGENHGKQVSHRLTGKRIGPVHCPGRSGGEHSQRDGAKGTTKKGKDR